MPKRLWRRMYQSSRASKTTRPFPEQYIQFLIESVPGLKLDGLRIVADCANGAAAGVAPELFARLGARTPNEVALLNISPNGRNINDGCGALHPQWVAAEVQKRGASIGLTFDGDADRCMLAGAHHNVINGDAILLIAARDLKARGMLTGDLVVATTMSNMGLEAALRRSGIRMLRASVGDRYVLEQMQQHGAALGGEQSGHILFPHLATTGDGLLTALVVLDLIARTGKTVDELTADLKVYPQVIVNVKVREKKPLETIPAVAERIRAAKEELRDSGRVVIRYSGTEALARVMIEAESEEAMRRHANAIASAIRTELGDSAAAGILQNQVTACHTQGQAIRRCSTKCAGSLVTRSQEGLNFGIGDVDGISRRHLPGLDNDNRRVGLQDRLKKLIALIPLACPPE